ncbi:XRE family transcriptional regulator [Marivirga lumbricoides]|uniref:XRE family transcriptional regulator n=1 Tax=Marivirga lumbricoides TaxID=1046115 RepID=A0A2T4DRL8_9BACT|nr:XRE family transcriptional regulator [Marivirga lumbricoides]
MENQSIAKNLVYHRKLKGFSQEKLSETTGVTVRTIQRIEKGDVNPHLETIKLLADGLQIQTDDLLVLENPKEESLQMKWLLIMHGVPIIGLMIPFFNILVSIFLWIHKREDNAIYDRHGRAIINFQITVTLLYALSFVALLTVEGWGFLFFISVIPFSLIVMLANIVYVLKAQKCFYPLAIPVFRNKRAIVTRIGILFFAFSITSCQNSTESGISRLDGSTITTDSLTSKINQLMTDAHVHGLAITIFDNNEISYQKAFGYANAETKDSLKLNDGFYGASFSKAVFGYLVAQLAKEGILDLDKPLQEYYEVSIPEIQFEKEWRGFRELEGDLRYEEITARMCMSHSTGFPNWRWVSRAGEFTPEGKLFIEFDPGTQYSYSGEGMFLLQYAIEHITGKGLEELARERIFDPLHMNMTSYLWQERFKNKYCNGHTKKGKIIPKDSADEAGAPGSMETTMPDYARFVQQILTLSKDKSKVTELMFEPNIEIHTKEQFGALSLEPSNEFDELGLNYGLGWGLLQSPYGFGAFKEGHGDGFQHYSIIFPETGKGVVIMTNSDNGESIFKELLELTIKDVYTPWKWQNYIPYDYVGM